MLRVSVCLCVKLGSNHASHKLSLIYGRDFMLRISVISGLIYLGLIFGSNLDSNLEVIKFVRNWFCSVEPVFVMLISIIVTDFHFNKVL